MAWFGPALARVAVGQPEVRALGAASALFIVPLIAHLVTLALDPDRPPQRTRRGLLAVYLLASAASSATFLTYAPLFDPACIETCQSRDSIVPVGAADRVMLRQVVAAVLLAGGAWLTATALRGLHARMLTLPGRRLVAFGGLVFGLGTVVGAGLRLLRAVGVDISLNTREPVESAVALALSIGAMTVSAGVALGVVHAVLIRSRIRRISEGMALVQQPDSLASALATALEDPTLRVGYWLPDEGRLVDASGAPFGQAPASELRTSTLIQRNGSPIATLEHRDDLDAEVVTNELRPSVLVALDNERLRAVQLAQLHELQESRARIVEVADAERRSLERDLHDGAQQRLLAIAFDLRLGRLTAARAGDERSSLLGVAEDLTMALIDELRRLCRGIHPQVLTQAGLAPALASLGEESSTPLAVHSELRGRLPVAVETAAYQIVVEALSLARQRGAAELSVDLAQEDLTLTVRTADGLADALEVPVRLADRIGAAGGELLTGTSSAGTFMRAVLPCA
jgi:signal transduction histidine kinase